MMNFHGYLIQEKNEKILNKMLYLQLKIYTIIKIFIIL
jgi:hypothetical protein